MRTGFASVELPVPQGTRMGGYADRDGGSTGVLDPLTVSVLTWSDGHRRVAVAIVEVVCVNADLSAAVRAEVADVDLLWVVATHTHSGPETGCRPGGTPTPPAWREGLVRAVREAAARAIMAERGTTATVHSGPLRHVGAARSRPAPDPVVPLTVVAVRRGGRIAGLLVELPVHPTVLPATNRMVSADLPGAVRRALARQLPGTWIAVATGAAGDISTRHTRRGHGPGELTRLGELVADRCLELLDGPGRPGWSTDDQPVWRSRNVLLLARHRSSAEAAAELVNDEAAHRSVREGADPVLARIAEGRLQGARLAVTLAGWTGDLDVEVGVLRLGRLALVALPGEPFLGLAAAVVGMGPVPTVVLGYANSYPGYLPTRDAYHRADYEVLASVVAPGGGEHLVEAARDLMTDLFPKE